MPTRFIGREQELRGLAAAYRSRESGLLPIYGRRRVGKSELILHFMRGKPHIYVVGKRAPASLQIRDFLETAAESLRNPLLRTVTQDDWKLALRTVVEHYRGKRKLIIALDEFQWMAESSSELTSVIQELWDRYWRDSGRVLLILCGSYVGFMEREVLRPA